MENHTAKTLAAVLFFFATVMFVLNSQSKTYLSDEMNIYKKIAAGEPYRYLIIGDSIGRGSGAESPEARWFAQLEQQIRDFSGSRAKRTTVVQSGATAFEGIYKLQQQPMTQDLDLIFIVFGENDRKYMDADEFTFFYEKLIRDAKERFATAEIVTIIESPLKQEPFANAIKLVSSHYGAKYIDMRTPFKDSGIPINQLTTDMVHPNGTGYQIYANSIFELLIKNIDRKADIASLPETFIQMDTFSLGAKKEAAAAGGFVFKNGIFTGSNPGDFLEFGFHGTVLGVNTVRNPDGGMLNVYIDGSLVTTLSTWWPFARERHLYIASGLEDGLHTVRFEIIDQVSPNHANGSSIVQILSIITAMEKNSE